MQKQVLGGSVNNRIELILNDITTMEVDAIVNAANQSLSDGSGVNGAIHRAAGPQLSRACRALNGCKTGEAKITEGFNLLAKYIIHTVGPVWYGGSYREEELLANCYQSSLRLAAEKHCKTIAFPAIACGIYAFPIKRAAMVAVREVAEFLKKNDSILKVYLVCFEEDIYEVYDSVLTEFRRAHAGKIKRAWDDSSSKESDAIQKISERKQDRFFS